MLGVCTTCNNDSFYSEGGCYYCKRCNSQVEDVRVTGIDEDCLFETYNLSHRREQPSAANYPISAVPISQVHHLQFQQHYDSFDPVDIDYNDDDADGVGPTGPSDFGSSQMSLSYDDYYTEIRMRYVMGIQIMIELQCKTLVEEFGVSPLIIGLVGPIWMRFLAFSRVMADQWADEVIHESEDPQTQGEREGSQPIAKCKAEPHNLFGKRVVTIWHRSLKRRIPLSFSLAISFLVCHLAREAILPTDILKWTLEGKLPYFAAFLEIEKEIGPPPRACPVSSSSMFRPTQAIPLQKLESQAAYIAQVIGLELPPVNFYAIASRFLGQLNVPVQKILPQACCIYEWSMPPELYLSTNKLRLPTRVCVMSILIVTIRIIYDLNGFGKWEMSLASPGSSSSLTDDDAKEESISSKNLRSSDTTKQGCSFSRKFNDKKLNNREPELDAARLLQSLESRYNDLHDMCEYSKDLPSYLQFCKDVVFAGLEPSIGEHEEEKMIEDLWRFYQNKQGVDPSNEQKMGSPHCSTGNKRSRDCGSTLTESKRHGDHAMSEDNDAQCEDALLEHPDCQDSESTKNEEWGVHLAGENHKMRAIRQLKVDMEENRFCYIPPRVKVKRKDYIQYARKKKGGAYMYAAHADYYILLRSCAKVAQVDTRTMHLGVLYFERQLNRIEQRIDYCLNVKLPKDCCDLCHDEFEHNCTTDPINFSKLNL